MEMVRVIEVIKVKSVYTVRSPCPICSLKNVAWPHHLWWTIPLVSMSVVLCEVHQETGKTFWLRTQRLIYNHPKKGDEKVRNPGSVLRASSLLRWLRPTYYSSWKYDIRHLSGFFGNAQYENGNVVVYVVDILDRTPSGFICCHREWILCFMDGGTSRAYGWTIISWNFRLETDFF